MSTLFSGRHRLKSRRQGRWQRRSRSFLQPMQTPSVPGMFQACRTRAGTLPDYRWCNPILPRRRWRSWRKRCRRPLASACSGIPRSPLGVPPCNRRKRPGQSSGFGSIRCRCESGQTLTVRSRRWRESAWTAFLSLHRRWRALNAYLWPSWRLNTVCRACLVPART